MSARKTAAAPAAQPTNPRPTSDDPAVQRFFDTFFSMWDKIEPGDTNARAQLLAAVESAFEESNRKSAASAKERTKARASGSKEVPHV